MSGSELLTFILIVLFGIVPNLSWGRGRRIFPLRSREYGLTMIGLSVAFFLLAANSYCWPIEAINWPATDGTITATRSEKKKDFVDFRYRVGKREISATKELSIPTKVFVVMKSGQRIKVHRETDSPSSQLGLEFGFGWGPVGYTVIALFLTGIGFSFMFVVKT